MAFSPDERQPTGLLFVWECQHPVPRLMSLPLIHIVHLLRSRWESADISLSGRSVAGIPRANRWSPLRWIILFFLRPLSSTRCPFLDTSTRLVFAPALALTLYSLRILAPIAWQTIGKKHVFLAPVSGVIYRGRWRKIYQRHNS